MTHCNCAIHDDALDFEHAGQAIFALSDTERTVLGLVMGIDPLPDPVPASLAASLRNLRPAVLHAATLLQALGEEDRALAFTYADAAAFLTRDTIPNLKEIP